MTHTPFPKPEGSCCTPSDPARAACGYKIRMKDHLDPYWIEWFDGWTLTHLENGEFLLSRARVDHSALHGVLNKILDLNLTLISVTRVPYQGEELTNVQPDQVNQTKE